MCNTTLSYLMPCFIISYKSLAHSTQVLHVHFLHTPLKFYLYISETEMRVTEKEEIVTGITVNTSLRFSNNMLV